MNRRLMQKGEKILQIEERIDGSGDQSDELSALLKRSGAGKEHEGMTLLPLPERLLLTHEAELLTVQAL